MSPSIPSVLQTPNAKISIINNVRTHSSSHFIIDVLDFDTEFATVKISKMNMQETQTISSLPLHEVEGSPDITQNDPILQKKKKKKEYKTKTKTI